MVHQWIPLLLTAALLAGCTSSPGDADEPADPLPGEEAQAQGTPRHFANDFNLTGTGATVCGPGVHPEAMQNVNWIGVIVDREANDTHIAVRFDWTAVNPTSDAIRFRVMDGPVFQGSAVLDEWNGISYQVRDFDAEQLAALPNPFYVEASLTGCPPEGVVGVHLNEKGLMEQPVHFQISWNGHPFET